MRTQLYNDNWVVTKRSGQFGAQAPVTVTLPYDAMLFTERRADAPFASGNYALGKWEYKKSFTLPAEDAGKKVFFQFDGVYQNALVYINGAFAGQRSNGYVQFFVDATPFVRWGEENELKVLVHLADGARWYSGAGIYRDVYLLTAQPIYIVPKGVKLTTPQVDEALADVQIRTTLCNQSGRAAATVRVETVLYDPDGKVAASRSAPVTLLEGHTETLQQKLWVEAPQLWSLERPALYTCCTRLLDADGTLLDESCEPFGIRTFRLSPKTGLCLNGKPIKLQGCGIHHENGPIGAVSTDAVEERKIARLKAAGFNAVRTAHNPASEALLRACDKLGMLVMHEAFDTWTVSKVDFDNTLYFQQNWKDDLRALVDVSFNHPSVLMYSIGNEIADTGTPTGGARGREITQYLRSLDSSRYVINSINGMVSAMDLMMKLASDSQNRAQQDGQDAINGMMSNLADQMRQITSLELIGDVIEESCTYLDIVGYNYMDARYEKDTAAHPNRILCGTETFIPTISGNWTLVKKMPNVIGDFCWTGWDYCGEPGTGLVKHVQPPFGFDMGLPFPCLLSHVGEFTISGFRRPCSYYHEIVLGLRKQPYIAVQRPEHHDGLNILTPWSWTDCVGGWSWDGYEGKSVTVEVYSDADEVELLCNGISLGRKPTGEANDFRAYFETVYTPGELTAVAYTDGKQTGSFSLRSAAGKCALQVEPEQTHYSLKNRDMIYLPIRMSAENGETVVQSTARVHVELDGAAEFMGFGTDEPLPTENFMDRTRTLYDGRALLVLRPTAAGTVHVWLGTEGCEAVTIDLDITE